MLFPIGVALDNVLIDAALALIALCVGFYLGVWYIKNSSYLDGDKLSESASQRDLEARANEVARANMAAQQMRDLAHNVASEVGAHNTFVSGISDELGAIDIKSPDANASVVDAVAKIMSANETLQSRLADAEQKIRAQAEELKIQQSEARTDALTKLANRRAFDDVLAQNISLYRRKGQPFSLLFFDVDHFKQFNDTHGHQAGDEVLRCVGKTLANVVKDSDIPCRYGGEEFALVMPSTPVVEGRIAAERVRKAIEAMDVEFEGKSLHVTISVGLAEAVQGEDAVKLIGRADSGVYVSKAAGRNCGHWHDGTDYIRMDLASNPKTTPSETPEQPLAADGSEQSLDALPDQAAFTRELQRRVAESHRFGVSLASMHIDVRNYGELEKEYGDAVGRLLLDSVAQFIRSSLRDMDLLGTLDPGEFAVMLPGSTEDEAQVIATRIHLALSSCAIPLNGKDIQLELGIGVSDVKPNDDALSMMGRAETKSAGMGKKALSGV